MNYGHTCINFMMHLLSYRFDQLRIKREKYPGKQSTKPSKYDESIGFLLFQAEVFTAVGKITCYKMSTAIKLSKQLPYAISS